MGLEELLSIDFTGQNIAILGKAASGKTWLSKQLATLNPYHLLFHGDDYIEHGFENSAYALLEEINQIPDGVNTIVEGIAAYRLLRKGLELHQYKANSIIICEISTKRQHEIYKKERDDTKLKYIPSFELGNMKVYNDYQQLLKQESVIPMFYYFENNY